MRVVLSLRIQVYYSVFTMCDEQQCINVIRSGYIPVCTILLIKMNEVVRDEDVPHEWLILKWMLSGNGTRVTVPVLKFKRTGFF